MRLLAIATLFFAVSCASPEGAPTGAEQAQATATQNYGDARSVASDDAVRDARRAYRTACQQSNSDGWCECMTGGMAQALPPAELAIATAAFAGGTVQASDPARQHVAQTRAAVERGCDQFR
ncbi:MAG: hypothetical protein KF779_13045 [Hyphomonadaceae bacterium]|nr:hypothetical protein [Hyphomonadaceae bacterium]